MLLSLLIQKFATAAAAAAALGVSRQAFHQAAKRGRFSDSVILRAAELLGLDASAPLLQRAQLATRKPEDSPTPIPCPAPETSNDVCECRRDTLYYVNSSTQKETDCTSEKIQNANNDSPKNSNQTIVKVHVHPHYQKNQSLIDVIRWCLCVPKLPPDSPRFAYYVSRWLVPEKIARAKADGTFDDIVRNCPPFDPAHIALVPAALAEYDAFKSTTRLKSSTNKLSTVKSNSFMLA